MKLFFWFLERIEMNKNNLLNWSILINRGKENDDDFQSNGEWNGIWAQENKPFLRKVMFLKKCDWQWNVLIDLILMEFLSKEGETPVWLIGMFFLDCWLHLKSHITWECNINVVCIFKEWLNIDEKPIVNKYCEGKLKRTL